MRPGGRPKSYSNGARWVNARGGRKRKSEINKEEKKIFNPLDIDRDGKVTPFEIKFLVYTYFLIYGIATIFLIWFFSMAYWGIQIQKA